MGLPRNVSFVGTSIRIRITPKTVTSGRGAVGVAKGSLLLEDASPVDHRALPQLGA